MPRAVLDKGVIRPLEPLPADWRDGEELRVERADVTDLTADEIDRDFAQLAALCCQGNSEEDAKLAAALDEAREQSKQQVRRSMGLS